MNMTVRKLHLNNSKTVTQYGLKTVQMMFSHCLTFFLKKIQQLFEYCSNTAEILFLLLFEIVQNVQILFEFCLNTVLKISEILSRVLFPLCPSRVNIFQILFASLSVRGCFFWCCK